MFDDKPAEYTVQNVEENEFLNEKNTPADTAKYGLTYWVKFTGDAGTFLWTTKTPPEEGKTYWGHIQPTSGKSMRFKTDKREDSSGHASISSPDASHDKYLKDTSDVPRSIVIELLKYYDVQSLYNSPKYTEMIKLAQSLNDDIMMMINGNRNTGSQSPKPTSGLATQAPREEASEPSSLRKKWDERAVTANELESLEETYVDEE